MEKNIINSSKTMLYLGTEEFNSKEGKTFIKISFLIDSKVVKDFFDDDERTLSKMITSLSLKENTKVKTEGFLSMKSYNDKSFWDYKILKISL